MALNYKNINGETSTVNRITFNGQDVQQLRYAKFGEKISAVWCKPYTLTIENKIGISQIKVTRTESEEPTAALIELHNGDVIYDGDTLAFEVTPQNGFELDQSPANFIVQGDVNIADIITVKPKQYSLNITQGNGVSSVTVTRDSSPYQLEKIGEIPLDSPIYYGDVIRIIAVPVTGYEIDPYQMSYSVNSNISANITANLKLYTLNYTQDAGVNLVTITRTHSSFGNTGTLSIGSSIYYGDIINVSVTSKTGYTVISGQGTYTITQNLTLNITTQVSKYRLTAGKGTGVDEVVWTRTESPLKHAPTGQITTDDAIYYGDKLHVSATAMTGFNLSQYTSDYTVTGNITAEFNANIKTYTLTIVKNTGVSNIRVVRMRNDTLNENNSYELANGGIIKHFDQLSVTVSANNYYTVSPSQAAYSRTVSDNVRVSPIAEPKSYTLRISKDSGVSSVIVERKSTIKQGASLGQLNNGSAIYYGDTLNVRAYAYSGYELNAYTYSYTVSENVSINVTSHSTKPMNAPRISGSMSHDSNSNAFYVTLYITNPNNISVTADILVKDCYSSDTKNDTVTLSPNENRTYPVGEMYTTKVEATVTLRRGGYTTMTNSEILQGSFGSSSGSSGSTSSGQS